MDFSYMRYEHMRTTRSHDHLPAGDRPGMFSRKSSLADLAYVALPGLTSRVTRHRSTTSLTNLSDTFSDMPEAESPVYIEGSASRPLVHTIGVALLSTLLYGYNNGNMNTPATAMRASLGIPATAMTPDGKMVLMHSNDTLWGFVVSIFALGALLGCNSSSQLADRWGRKTFLLWNSMLFVIGGLIEAAAALPECAPTGGWAPCTSRVGTLIIGRAVSGIACGGATVVVPMYLGEISPAHLRGACGTINQLTMVVGMLMAQVLGLPALLGSNATWPTMLALVLPVALLQLLLQPVLLESPRWYAMYGNETMAEEMLVLLRDQPPDDEEVQEELFCMLQAVQTSHDFHPGPLSRSSSTSSFGGGRIPSFNGLNDDGGLRVYEPPSSLLEGTQEPILRAATTNPAVRKALYVTLLLMAVQQLSGINNAFNYSSTFLKQNGLSDETCTLVAISMNVANCAVTLASVLLMDSVGRRPLLLFSLVGMALAAALLTFALDMADPSWTPPLAIASVLGFVSAFGIGLGPVALLLPAEIFPAAYRSTGSGLAMSAMWLCNFVSAQVFLPQALLLQTQAFAPHLGVLLLGLLFAVLSMPETRGKSLETIEREMSAT